MDINRPAHFYVGRFKKVLLLAIVLAAPFIQAAPVEDHPRIWVRSQDIAKYRSWAVPSNPVYQNGLRDLAVHYKAQMDSGLLYQEDNGSWWAGVSWDIASGSELFAFMSMVANDPAERADYGQRARTLAMYVINQVLQPSPNTYFSHKSFSTNYRGNFHGETIPLALDWAYPYFSADDKAKIRQVFLRWIGENLTATTSGMDHPEPVGVVRDPLLFADKQRLRNALNNFGASHMRNILFMALALDNADDPDDLANNANNPLPQYQRLRDYVDNASGAWLYMVDEALKKHAAGGVNQEGFEYNGASTARMMEVWLALHTSGYADTALYGDHVVLENNPFWEHVLPGYFHTISPVPYVPGNGNQWMGEVYQPANFGDIEKYWTPDFMSLFGPMALHAQYTGNHTERVDQIRWIEKYTAPGGASRLLQRASDFNNPRNTQFYFMLFDPSATTPQDPRPALDKHLFAPGTGLLTARTGWGEEASWLSYFLSWNKIDHQHGTGNMVQWFRKGEWITKEWSGYGSASSMSSYKNTLALLNDGLANSQLMGTQKAQMLEGSQPAYTPAADPTVIAWSDGEAYTYVSGDATNLYNTDLRWSSQDLLEASRSVFWFKPDQVVIYDRAESKSVGKFKRFWLNFAEAPFIQGQRATSQTPGGQLIALDTLLPASAVPIVDSALPNLSGYNETALLEPMKFRVMVEAPNQPAKTRFLHVLQAADNQLLQPSLVASLSGDEMQGTVLNNSAVLFAENLRSPVSSSVYQVPTSVTQHYLTGLAPNSPYSVTRTVVAAGQQKIQLASGGNLSTDGGGVLAFAADNSGVQPLPAGTASYFTDQALDKLVKVDNPNANAGANNNAGNNNNNQGGSQPSNGAANSNGQLSNLVIAGLSPAFSPDVHNYTLIAPAGGLQTSIPVTATLADPTLKLHIQSSETASGQTYNAWLGNGKIDIVVYQGWNEVGRYTVTAIDSHLSNLVINGLSPAFSPTVTNYTIPAPASGLQSSIPVTASLADASLKLHIQSSETASGQTYNAWLGNGKIDLVIYQGWTEVGRYTVTVNQNAVTPPPASENVSGTLNNLVIPGLSPAFSPSVKSYTVSAAGASSLPVTATLGNAGDQLYVNSSPTSSGQTTSVWLGNGKISLVLYKNWSEVGRYTITVTP
ncbi:MAG: cadherin-like beta sandwich domain-containing protein [Methylococcales bacterium]|nr:cadherin-like beta sandwich domain-containing protein [Methylococcales bacterium]